MAGPSGYGFLRDSVFGCHYFFSFVVMLTKKIRGIPLFGHLRPSL